MNIVIAALSFCYSLISLGESLKCWKCIGSDCSGDPSTLPQSVPMKCPNGESCMKVHYAVEDFNTSTPRDSVTRTCSSNGCKPTPQASFLSCLSSRDYHVMGCNMRFCCKNKDLCNSCTMPMPVLASVLTSAIVAYTLCRMDIR